MGEFVGESGDAAMRRGMLRGVVLKMKKLINRRTEQGCDPRACDPTSRGRRGVMAVLAVITLPVLLAFFVLMVNVAWMQLTRAELRVATDAAVSAGGHVFAGSSDQDAARQAAKLGAAGNMVAGAPLILADSDVQFGYSVPKGDGLWQFVEQQSSMDSVNAVRVTGRRVSGAPSGPVPLLFTGMFEQTLFEPVMSATETQASMDLVLVLDYSVSMLYPPDYDDPSNPKWYPNDGVKGAQLTAFEAGVEDSRWMAMRRAVEAFLVAAEKTPHQERIGLVIFGFWHHRKVDLSTNYDGIRQTMNAYGVSSHSAIGSGVQTATKLFEAAGNCVDPTAVLITDGHRTWGIQIPHAFLDAKDEGVRINAITFGSHALKSPINQLEKWEAGAHWHTEDEAELQELLINQLSSNLRFLRTE